MRIEKDEELKRMRNKNIKDAKTVKKGEIIKKQ